MSLVAAYIFNEYSGSGVPTSFLDWKSGYNLNSAVGIAMSSVNSDGYDVIMGASGHSHLESTTLVDPGGIYVVSWVLRIKCAAPPSGTYVLVKKGGFSIVINSSGFVVFTLVTNAGTYSMTSSVNVCDGGYHSIICTSDKLNLNIYTDGNPDTPVSAVYTTILYGAGAFFIGAASPTDVTTYYQGTLGYVMFYSHDVLTDNDAINISNSTQKGASVNGDINNFKTGDILADQSLQNTAVVSWVTDDFNYAVIPLGGTLRPNAFIKYGSMLDKFRQNLIEIDADFDGNNNGQIRLLQELNSFTAYNNPVNPQVWDYRGLVAHFCHWFCEYQQRQNSGTTITNLYTETLLAQSIVKNGDYLEFEYWFNSANNANSKTVNLVFYNTALVTVSPSQNKTCKLKGTIVITDFVHQTILYDIEYTESGSAPTFYRGTSSTYNFNTNLHLILQAQGAATGDIIATGGKGMKYRASSL